jgi:hypothetical protein
MAAPEYVHLPRRYGIRSPWLLTVSATTLALIGFSSSAYAACDPAAASNVTADCTGTTDNQGAGAPGTRTDPNGYGYGTGVENNLTVTVAPGANVTGAAVGIFANSLTLTNSGTIFGFSEGVEATTANITNSGLIRGMSHTIVANTATVTNSGTISGDAGNGIEAVTATVTDSGNISAAFLGVRLRAPPMSPIRVLSRLAAASSAWQARSWPIPAPSRRRISALQALSPL